MSLPTAFRLSTYCCLAIATACLGYMQELHVPGISGFFVAVELFIVVAFVVRDRWVMPAAVANVLALLIVIGWGTWFWVSMSRVRGGGSSVVDLMPWVMPRMGPLLGILLLAKLFRPKRAPDYWWLHGLALIQVALACVLGRNAFLGVLLLGYLVTGVWSLLLFYQHRESTPSFPNKSLGTGVVPKQEFGNEIGRAHV